MPTYDAQCESCGKIEEYSSSMNGYRENTPTCTICNVKMVHKFSGNSGGFRLMGGGWPGELIKNQNRHRKLISQPDNSFKGVQEWKKSK